VREWIEQMASSYYRSKYGARVWMEHIRGTLPDAPFRAYDDILAVKAEDVEIDGKKLRALFAQIEPTDDLVSMVNKLKQKIFTSIEVREKFAYTGKTYLMGLGVTDTPASLGTEMLAFSAQHPDAGPLKARKQSQDQLFTVMAHAFNSSLAPQKAVSVLCKSDGAQTGRFSVEAGPIKTLRALIGTGLSWGCLGWRAVNSGCSHWTLTDSNRPH
jgi:hypothetical protein